MSTDKANSRSATRQQLDNKSVYKLYILIVLVLGVLGGLSLFLGKDTYTASIVTALTTIAGFAVGDVANVTK